MKKAFTMAEILLSLTIIGVVAAITLPSLTGNINERTWNTQRKALYARMSQAISLMPALNGFGTVTEESSSGAGDGVDTATETFLTGGLAKVLKINNICDNTHFQDCGIVSEITNLKGTKNPTPTTLKELHSTLTTRAPYTHTNTGGTYYFSGFSQPDVKAAAFETANGESVVLYYNPTCVSMLGENGMNLLMQRKMCLNFIFDLNGTKGPNTVGKDIGIMSVFYPTDSVVVAPMPLTQDGADSTTKEATKACTRLDAETRLPNREELASIYINSSLIGRTSGRYWSATTEVINAYTVRWHVNLADSVWGWANSNASETWKVMCVKRN